MKKKTSFKGQKTKHSGVYDNRKKNGQYYIEWTIGVNDRKGCFVDCKTALEAYSLREAKKKQYIKERLEPKKEKLTFKVFAERIIKENRTARPGTIKHNNACLRILEKEIGNSLIANITESELKNVFDMLYSKYSLGYVKNIITFTKTIFKNAIRQKIILENPMEYIKNPAPKKSTKIIPKSEDIQKLLDYFKKNNKFWYVVCRVLLCGLREGETRALTWNDIDFQNGQISINKTADTFNNINATKTDNERVFGLPKDLLDILKKHKTHTDTLPSKESNLVFPSEKWNNRAKGWKFGEGNISKHIFRSCAYLQIQPLTSHHFRHYVNKSLLDKGFSAPTVKSITGHSTASMLHWYYQSDKETTQKALNNLPK